jgi:hypothetical protein
MTLPPMARLVRRDRLPARRDLAEQHEHAAAEAWLILADQLLARGVEGACGGQ